MVGHRRTREAGALLAGAVLIACAVAAVLWLVPPLSRACCVPPPGDTTPPDPIVPVRPDEAFALTVDHVYDGDTIRATVLAPNAIVTTDGSVRIRLIGIDTPEGTPTVECWADEARDHLSELLPVGERVWAAPDRDSWDDHGRRLFYLWTDDGTFVNHELVTAGDAVAIRVRPNDAHFALLSAAQDAAEAASLGRWGHC